MKHVFIVNPYAGNMTFANNLRQQLEQIDGFEYFLFNSLMRQKNEFIEKHARVGKGKKMTIMRTDRGPIVANPDGEMISASGEWTVEMRPESVKLVVPKGVRLP